MDIQENGTQSGWDEPRPESLGGWSKQPSTSRQIETKRDEQGQQYNNNGYIYIYAANRTLPRSMIRKTYSDNRKAYKDKFERSNWTNQNLPRTHQTGGWKGTFMRVAEAKPYKLYGTTD